jgi:pyrroline-5-carboxylate reductase
MTLVQALLSYHHGVMKLGVIGCGKMGSALVEGALKAGVLSPGDLLGCDPMPEALDAFVKTTGGQAAADAAQVGASCDVLLLSTKPQEVAGALKLAARGAKGKPRLVISIAAGLTLEALQKEVPKTFRVIRTMPNTPAMVGQGASAFCRGDHATDGDAEFARKFFEAVGLAIEVPEKLIDAVTGVSGSGPAYVYLMIEAMADGGVKAGLGRADAIRLAAQTFLGAAKMVLDTGRHPAVLKDMVTSPGGTTIAGLAEMEKQGVRAALIDAVEASVRRAGELGKG